MWLRPIDLGFDRRMMQSLVLLSSSEAARQAATAWLAAFEAARAAGAEEAEAHARAAQAWRSMRTGGEGAYGMSTELQLVTTEE